MKTRPLVSVIIPVYNAEQFLRESMESILHQTYENLEILICDDCSGDRSWEIIKTFTDPRIRVFRNEVNKGYLRSINFLASESKGDFLCFQDADDFSHAERIRIQLNELISKPALGFVGSNYATIKPGGKILRVSNVQTNPIVLKQLVETANPFLKPSIMFRRDVYNKVGMYREEFLELGNISEDFDWILRVSENFEMGNINYNHPLYFYRSVPTAMSKDVKFVSQLFGHEVALCLYKERKSGQPDSISRGDLKSVLDFINELKKPYEHHNSLFHKKLAESLMYAGLYLRAIRQATMAVLKEPLKFNNYRLLQYCIRKTLFGF